MTMNWGDPNVRKAVEEDVERHVRAGHPCPQCNRSLERAHITVTASLVWPVVNLTFQCSLCMVIGQGYFRISGVMMDDAVQHQKDEAPGRGAIEADEVLEVHEFLKNFTGNLAALVNQK